VPRWAGPFARVLGAPHVRLLLAASVLARLPYGILGLATLLFVQEQSGSFGSAGVVSASAAFAAAAAMPGLGRLVDRLGQTRVLLGTIVVQAAGNVSLVALGLAGAPTAALVAVAIVGGAAVPPVGPALRGLWGELLGGDPGRVRSALALDAIALEVVFIGGPVIAAVIIALASPAAALLTGVALSAAGTAAFASAPPSRRWRSAERAGRGRLGPLAAPGVRTLLLSTAGLGVAFGSMEVALPAFGVEHGSRSLGGLALAAFAAGSAIGGIWYGAVAPRRVRDAYLALSVLMPLGVVLVATAWSAPALIALAPLAGVVVAPLTAAQNELAGALAPAGSLTEAYAWVVTALVAGLAAGIALGGALVDAHGWQAPLLAGAACGLAGAAIALARRETLAG
jgi:MFS family permease